MPRPRKESGYSVPDFEKISKAYGIRAATLKNYHELDNYSDWLQDDQACLLNIMLPSESFLVPKIRWKTSHMEPELPDGIANEVKGVLIK